MKIFDCYNYFENIHSKLKAIADYKFCRIIDKNTMEELVNNSRTAIAFFCVDDTEDGQIQPSSGGYSERRVYFIWILKKYQNKEGSKAQSEAMEECRSIYHDIVGKLISDKDGCESGLTYMQDRFPFWEIPAKIFPDLTGLYFSITVDTPLSLCVKPDNWN